MAGKKKAAAAKKTTAPKVKEVASKPDKSPVEKAVVAPKKAAVKKKPEVEKIVISPKKKVGASQKKTAGRKKTPVTVAPVPEPEIIDVSSSDSVESNNHSIRGAGTTSRAEPRSANDDDDDVVEVEVEASTESTRWFLRGRRVAKNPARTRPRRVSNCSSTEQETRSEASTESMDDVDLDMTTVVSTETGDAGTGMSTAVSTETGDEDLPTAASAPTAKRAAEHLTSDPGQGPAKRPSPTILQESMFLNPAVHRDDVDPEELVPEFVDNWVRSGHSFQRDTQALKTKKRPLSSAVPKKKDQSSAVPKKKDQSSAVPKKKAESSAALGAIPLADEVEVGQHGFLNKLGVMDVADDEAHEQTAVEHKLNEEQERDRDRCGGEDLFSGIFDSLRQKMVVGHSNGSSPLRHESRYTAITDDLLGIGPKTTFKDPDVTKEGVEIESPEKPTRSNDFQNQVNDMFNTMANSPVAPRRKMVQPKAIKIKTRKGRKGRKGRGKGKKNIQVISSIAELDLENAEYEIPESKCQSFEVEDENETPFCIRVKWEGEPGMRRFNFVESDKCVNIKRDLSRDLLIPIRDIEVYFPASTELLDDSKTMGEARLGIGSILNAYRVDRSGVVSAHIDPDALTLRMQCENRKKLIMLTVSKTDTFGSIRKEYAEKAEVDEARVRLHFDGDVLDLSGTPEDEDFEGGECIDVTILPA